MFSRARQIAKRKWAAPVLALGLVALILGVAGPSISASREALEYDELEFFIEVNDTDGDAGVQLMLDGEQWKRLKMFSPDGGKMLDIKAEGSLNIQGLTELFFESAEPSFEDVPLDDFLDRFPEGEYTFAGKTIEGDSIVGSAELTHIIPDAPSMVSPVAGELVEDEDVVFEWEPVTGPAGVEIISYEVIVSSDEAFADFRILLPGSATSVEIPDEVFDPEVSEYEGEVLAREISGNQTITEFEFEFEFVSDDEDQDDDDDED